MMSDKPGDLNRELRRRQYLLRAQVLAASELPARELTNDVAEALRSACDGFLIAAATQAEVIKKVTYLG
jgi:hypothetical protein